MRIGEKSDLDGLTIGIPTWLIMIQGSNTVSDPNYLEMVRNPAHVAGFIVPALDSSLIKNDKHYRSKGCNQYECTENVRIDWILHRRSPPALDT